MNRLTALLDGLSEWTGRTVAWLTYGMVLLTMLVVILRYGFSLGYTALGEGVTYLFAMIFMFGAAYTLRHDDHVRVDVLYRRMSPRGQAWVNLLGTLLFLWPVMGLILWLSTDYVLASWSLLEGSREPGGLPFVYLLKSLLWLMPALLMLQGLADALRAIAVLRGGAAVPPDHLRTEV
ncbi:MAG: TRAP transporter small permease subunit [Halothiobacillaceae bacterium]|nr:MAG: TRAP transporter small permease subunit [Halothiobacillaceae bacterium]